MGCLYHFADAIHSHLADGHCLIYSVLHAGLRFRVASVFGSVSRRGEIGFAILFSFLLLLFKKMPWAFFQLSSLNVGIQRYKQVPVKGRLNLKNLNLIG